MDIFDQNFFFGMEFSSVLFHSWRHFQKWYRMAIRPKFVQKLLNNSKIKWTELTEARGNNFSFKLEMNHYFALCFQMSFPRQCMSLMALSAVNIWQNCFLQIDEFLLCIPYSIIAMDNLILYSFKMGFIRCIIWQHHIQRRTVNIYYHYYLIQCVFEVKY